ncbi:MAG TPA: transcription-repair coupling factor [Bacteroidota bacterium]
MKERLYRSGPFQHFAGVLQNARAGSTIQLSGVAGSLVSFIVAHLFELMGCQVLLVASEREKAEKVRDDLELLLGSAAARFFGDLQSVHRRPSSVGGQWVEQSRQVPRIETLASLQADPRIVVVADPSYLPKRLPPPGAFSEALFLVRVGEQCGFQRLIERLDGSGFVRKSFVEGYGDYAVRGGILDIFPYVGEHPVRLEFWGDTVESIREFDVFSQRSLKEVGVASIVPDILGGATLEVGRVQPSATLLDYLSRDAVVLIDEPALAQKSASEAGQSGDAGEDSFSWGEFELQCSRFRTIVLSSFDSSNASESIDFHSRAQPSFNASMKALYDDLIARARRRESVYLLCENQASAERLKELVEEVATDPNAAREERAGDTRDLGSPLPAMEFIADSVHHGFSMEPASLCVYTEHEIFGRNRRRGTSRRPHFKGFSAREFQALKKGDFVVHVDHGIGKFDGLQKLKIKGFEQEVVRLLYAEEGILYVNLNYIRRIQKFSSREGHLPKLSKLGSPDWDRLKARAKRRIKDIARDLIQLYARRKHEKGLSFEADTLWQKELEASFLYEDTPDQSTATDDVKRDMENENPMDRLICGDVGFGKTEVAVRAAFKAVMGGKQAAMLVPTTILAVQHHNTFLDRLSKYSVRVEVLSRFKGRSEQASILAGLRSGAVDIVIGTHRLLSRDVAFKDLGLLIIDEEHRFGVTAKEKLRAMKSTVDTLTLTATPIPRTLHFSLMGARDLSIIQTPPRNRLPIMTEIAEFNLDLIRDAILRELQRGGQVYFVYDRVQKIEEMAGLIQERVPEARCRVAHGQMRSGDLEKVMLDFLERKLDVLVCTKIIESGLDIPNVNTILINRADRFGMAELYQLRGRVGRSNLQAYSYLLVPPVSSLPAAAIRRLQAVEEFTELGSGFNLSMRDLEIRGAGNLLGAEQSGFIDAMGFEMYGKVLEEAVGELKELEFTDLFRGEKRAEKDGAVEATVEADVDAYLPEFFVEKDFERLDIYRRLCEVRDLGQLDEIRSELRDRFGPFPVEVENLFQLIRLRILATQAGFAKVELTGETLHIEFPDESIRSFYEDGRFQAIMERVASPDGRAFQLRQEGKKLGLLVRTGKGESPGNVGWAEDVVRQLAGLTPAVVDGEGGGLVGGDG